MRRRSRSSERPADPAGPAPHRRQPQRRPRARQWRPSRSGAPASTDPTRRAYRAENPGGAGPGSHPACSERPLGSLRRRPKPIDRSRFGSCGRRIRSRSSPATRPRSSCPRSCRSDQVSSPASPSPAVAPPPFGGSWCSTSPGRSAPTRMGRAQSNRPRPRQSIARGATRCEEVAPVEVEAGLPVLARLAPHEYSFRNLLWSR